MKKKNPESRMLQLAVVFCLMLGVFSLPVLMGEPGLRSAFFHSVVELAFLVVLVAAVWILAKAVMESRRECLPPRPKSARPKRAYRSDAAKLALWQAEIEDEFPRLVWSGRGVIKIPAGLRLAITLHRIAGLTIKAGGRTGLFRRPSGRRAYKTLFDD